MKKLFGTDGIRGVAGQPPLDPRTVRAVGLALGRYLKETDQHGHVLLGRDTRESGAWITETLLAALDESGIPGAFDAGVITTPGLAYLVRHNEFNLAIMISASHNPFEDNGIKVFSHDGFKLPDEVEIEIEKRIEEALKAPSGTTGSLPPGGDQQKLVEDYLSFLTGECAASLEGYAIGLDVANGAAFRIGPEVFRRLGARLEIINDEPDGRNINLNCGALHLEGLKELVVSRHLCFGIAFDGDADRCLFVTGSGKIFDGDYVLLALSESWQASGKLASNKVVGTLMTNFALEKALEKRALQLVRTAVGDKYVLEEMRRHGANLGGEPSGHIILSDHHTTGDGILTAVKLAELLAKKKTDLDSLSAGYEPFPQLLDGIRVREKIPLDSSAEIQQLIEEAKTELGESGRLVIRYSGTEPLLRIMAEGPDAGQVNQLVAKLKNGISAIWG